jgi:uncharacterized protein (DUF885 family)
MPRDVDASRAHELAPRGGTVTQPLRPDGLPEPTTEFDVAVTELIVDLFESNPVWGTVAGYHVVDGRWPDLSEAGRQARLAMAARHTKRLRVLPADRLSREQEIDRRILLEELDKVLFADAVLRSEAWDALEGVALMGSGFFGLLSREFAPWSQRGADLLARIEALPTLSRQLLDALTGLEDRPVALLHLEVALAQLAGVTDLVDAAVEEARTRAEAADAPELVEPMVAAASAARTALDEHRAALDRDVRPRASGDGRLGADLFTQKLRHTLGSELAPHELRDRAWADFHAVRAEMVRLARQTWLSWFPDEAMPDVAEGDEAGEAALVQRVLDAIAAVHQQPHGLIAYCEAEMERIVAFCRDNDVITLPAEPMTITWTPTFMRAYGRAFLDSPGPLDRGEESQFWITPPEESEGAEAVESYLREENDRMLRILTIHEGVPGHYLQLAASNGCSSLARTVFGSGMFAEGWAVYVTQVMMDLDYGADDPGLLLNHWKMYLRAIVNAILDVETHVGDMTEAEAMALMVEGGWQEPDEARGKWTRARITATQLSTYYVGSLEMWDLDVASRERAAVSVGASSVDVPPQHIAGGIGASPGFDQKTHLEAVIGHGTPAIKWCRALMLGDEPEVSA